ncbi:phosphoglycerate mutase family protein [Bifidobacterium bifidum]|nr:phosphoglycerate mutase family protein [Bifidobacterium bifidum]
MHFREQCYGYFEGQDMSLAWTAAGGPHGAKDYNDIVAKFGLAASRDFLKEADPFHDAESDEEYWTRVEGAFQLIASNPISRMAMMCFRFRTVTRCSASATISEAPILTLANDRPTAR